MSLGASGMWLMGPVGPAFGVALNEMPPRSWCTSLIGGQRHELPLIVFTVVEEIYRRGTFSPSFSRLPTLSIDSRHSAVLAGRSLRSSRR